MLEVYFPAHHILCYHWGNSSNDKSNGEGRIHIHCMGQKPGKLSEFGRTVQTTFKGSTRAPFPGTGTRLNTLFPMLPWDAVTIMAASAKWTKKEILALLELRVLFSGTGT